MKSNSIQPYVGIAFLIIGLILQFFTQGEALPWWIGSFLIFFAPYGQYGSSKPKPQKSKKSKKKQAGDLDEEKEKWRDITPDKLLAYFENMNDKSTQDGFFIDLFCSEEKSGARKLLAGLLMFFGLGMYAASNEFQIGAILVDLYWVPRFIARLSAGEYKQENGLRTNYGVVQGAKQVINSVLPGNIAIAPKVLMEKSEDDYVVTDIKFNISTKNKNPDVLCAMISVSKNEVMGLSYPFNYFVVVVKGTEKIRDAKFVGRVRDIVNSRSASKGNNKDDDEEEAYLIALENGGDSSPVVKLDASEKDGNSVFVVLTDSYPEYTTNAQDTAKILEVGGKIMALLEK